MRINVVAYCDSAPTQPSVALDSESRGNRGLIGGWKSDRLQSEQLCGS
jgi:hypothetical protein